MKPWMLDPYARKVRLSRWRMEALYTLRHRLWHRIFRPGSRRGQDAP